MIKSWLKLVVELAFIIFFILILSYLIPIIYNPGFLFFKAVIFCSVAGAAALLWSLFRMRAAQNKIFADLLIKYSDIEHLLIDFRDGTKSFFIEKRRHERIQCDLVACFAEEELARDFVRIDNVSNGGALMRTTRPLLADDTADLYIFSTSFPWPICVTAKVVSAHPIKATGESPVMFEVRVKFTSISSEDQKKLTATIRHLKKNQPE